MTSWLPSSPWQRRQTPEQLATYERPLAYQPKDAPGEHAAHSKRVTLIPFEEQETEAMPAIQPPVKEALNSPKYVSMIRTEMIQPKNKNAVDISHWDLQKILAKAIEVEDRKDKSTTDPLPEAVDEAWVNSPRKLTVTETLHSLAFPKKTTMLPSLRPSKTLPLPMGNTYAVRGIFPVHDEDLPMSLIGMTVDLYFERRDRREFPEVVYVSRRNYEKMVAANYPEWKIGSGSRQIVIPIHDDFSLDVILANDTAICVGRK